MVKPLYSNWLWLMSLLFFCCATGIVLAEPTPKFGDDLAALLKRLKSPFSNEVTTAARGIERLGPAAKAAVPDLNQALTKANFSDERIAIARALGAMGPAAEEAVPNIALALKRAGFPQERQALMKALAQIGPGAHLAVPTLVDVMRTGLPDDARLAAEVLGEIGPGARDAIPALRMAAGSGFTHLKATAAASLRKIQVNDARLGIRDNARIFSNEAIHKASEELQTLAARSHIGVLLETHPHIPAEQASRAASQPFPEGFSFIDVWAMDRTRTADFNGLYILICRNPLKVAVAPTPTAHTAFDQPSCVKLRDQILSRMAARQDDEILRDVVAFMKGRSLHGLKNDPLKAIQPQ
jgi:hypothetical protein